MQYSKGVESSARPHFLLATTTIKVAEQRRFHLNSRTPLRIEWFLLLAQIKMESATSPEMFLVVLAVAMCSILFCFTIGVVVIFHCCNIKDVNIQDLPAAVLERTRHSLNWARNSIFSPQSDYVEEVEDNRQFLSPQRVYLKTSTPIPINANVLEQSNHNAEKDHKSK
ncbi:hypothetical protein NECAME_03968 [Necator americanus]|uniref:Uncharacterized protein n=1 Tax=Necator americanus TaxID=51031 RepID=W2SY09_NECAM|nr:hypothetical protein NECAME_03968 [Necator americanus]ETN74654.1 hypothetical protein NECAME_03968 [Necator americanus]